MHISYYGFLLVLGETALSLKVTGIWLQIDHYALIIEAEDSGGPQSRSATTVVSVYVLDTNDNPPRFTQANYTARVQVGTISSFQCLLGPVEILR